MAVSSWQLGQIPRLQLAVKPVSPLQLASGNFLRLRAEKPSCVLLRLLARLRRAVACFSWRHLRIIHSALWCHLKGNGGSGAVFVRRLQPHTHRPPGELSVLRAADWAFVFLWWISRIGSSSPAPSCACSWQLAAQAESQLAVGPSANYHPRGLSLENVPFWPLVASPLSCVAPHVAPWAHHFLGRIAPLQTAWLHVAV